MAQPITLGSLFGYGECIYTYWILILGPEVWHKYLIGACKIFMFQEHLQLFSSRKSEACMRQPSPFWAPFCLTLWAKVFFFSKHFWLQDGSCDSWGEVSAFWKANIWPLTCVGILRSYKLISDYLPVNNEALTCPMSFPPSIYKTLLPSSALEI